MTEPMVICKKLAKRFKNTGYREDLVQEGILGWLEAGAQGETSPEVLERHALKAMRDFLNFKTKTVSVPSSGAARQALADLRRGTYQTDNLTSQRLGEALSDDSGEFVEWSLAESLSTATDNHLTYHSIIDVAYENLSYDDYKVFHETFVLGLPQKEVAKRNGVTQGTVSLWLKDIIRDLKDNLGEPEEPF